MIRKQFLFLQIHENHDIIVLQDILYLFYSINYNTYLNYYIFFFLIR